MSLMCKLTEECKRSAGMCKHEKAMLGIISIAVIIFVAARIFNLF